MLNFHRECWNPVKKHSKALVFFAVSKQIPIVYSADRGRAETKDGSSVQNIQKNGLYYRVFKKSNKSKQIYNQLIVLSKLRGKVLKIIYDGIMSGHLGIRKTTDRIFNEFFWPAVRKDVQQYCKV